MGNLFYFGDILGCGVVKTNVRNVCNSNEKTNRAKQIATQIVFKDGQQFTVGRRRN